MCTDKPVAVCQDAVCESCSPGFPDTPLCSSAESAATEQELNSLDAQMTGMTAANVQTPTFFYLLRFCNGAYRYVLREELERLTVPYVLHQTVPVPNADVRYRIGDDQNGPAQIDRLNKVLQLRPGNNSMRIDPLPQLSNLDGGSSDPEPGPGPGPLPGDYPPQKVQVSYYIYDHLGNTRILYHTRLNCNNEDGLKYVPEHVVDYYPFGKIMREWTNCEKSRFIFTGKERDVETGYDNFGARLYDGDLGRFLGVDPLSAERNWLSPYNYVQNNPVVRIDLTGALDDVYYDQDGNFLYKDDKETDFIRIVDTRKNNSYPEILKHKGKERTNFLNNYLEKNSVLISKADISPATWSKITTDILSKMSDIDVSKLQDGKVSVFDGTIGTSEGTPEKGQRSLANTTVSVNGEINITVYLYGGRIDSELTTVSNVENALGPHEFIGHGVKGFGSKTFNHTKAFELQFYHPTWARTTPEFKESQKTKYEYHKARGD